MSHPQPIRRQAGSRIADLAAWTALILAATLAQVALKAGGLDLADLPAGSGWLAAARADRWVIAGVVGYVGSFLAWMVILDRTDLSFGFPLTALVIVTVSLASLIVFAEPLSALRITGIALVVGGALLMGRAQA